MKNKANSMSIARHAQVYVFPGPYGAVGETRRTDSVADFSTIALGDNGNFASRTAALWIVGAGVVDRSNS